MTPSERATRREIKKVKILAINSDKRSRKLFLATVCLGVVLWKRNDLRNVSMELFEGKVVSCGQTL